MQNKMLKGMIKLKTLNKIDRFFAYISSGTLFLLMVWVFTDVIFRYFFNSPIVGTIEISGEYFMVMIVLLSLSYTHMKNGHINVELLYGRFPEKVKGIVRILTNLIMLILFIFLGLFNYREGMKSFRNDITSAGLLDYPIGPAYFIILIGILLMALRVAIESIVILRKDNSK